MKIQVKLSTNLEQDAIDWAGGHTPPGGFKYSEKWHPFASSGPLADLRYRGNHTRKILDVWSWKADNPKGNVRFYLKGFKQSEWKKNKENAPKNCAEEFNALAKEYHGHPYLLRKKIETTNLNIRFKPDTLNGKPEDAVIVPMFDTFGVMVGWQRIFPDGTKKNKPGHKLPPGHHFKIGQVKDRVYIAEGISTAYHIHKITGEHTLCGFSMNNLESVTEFATKTYKGKKIILALDNNGAHTLKPKLTKGIVVLCPEKEGDFDDFKDDPNERIRLLTLQNTLSKNIDLAPKKEQVKYLDRNNIFIRGKLMVETGEKASLKSMGTASYLFEQGIKIGYFSDHEVEPEEIREWKDQVGEGNSSMEWLNFERKDEDGFWENLGVNIKAKGIQLVWEDPPREDENFGNPVGVRKILTHRAKMAKKFKVCWLLSRNFSKNESKDILKRIGGFALFSTIPRALTATFKADPDSAIFKKVSKELEKGEKLIILSLLQSLVCNIGPLPQMSILLKLVKTSNGVFIKTEDIPRVKTPELWGKERSERAKAQTKTHEMTALLILDKEKNGLLSQNLKHAIMKECSILWPTAGLVLTNLRKAKWITGGGQGQHSKPIKITPAGKKELAEVEEEDNPNLPKAPKKRWGAGTR